MAFPDKNYTLGKGRLFFDQFAAGTKTKTGERYFGNTPEFNLTSESETLDHFDSDAGVRSKDDSVLLELNRTGTFITDHISPENLALFFLGEASVVSQSTATAASENITVKKGLWYQLGTAVRPEGVVNISNFTMEDDLSATIAAANYEVDAANGRFRILPDAADVADNDVVTVTYDIAAATINRVVTAGNAEVYGALRFIATNPKGEKFNYYFPYVAIRPNGDFALKGEEWQQLGFNVEVLKLDDSTESMYVTNVE